MPLLLTTEQAERMRAHAASEYPFECCGFLVGRIDPGFDPGAAMTLARVEPASNTRTDSRHNRFEIDPGALVKADRAARAEGLSVIGFYHSHPDAPARPSEYDREHAWPGYCYVIVSVEAGQPRDLMGWRLREDRSGFDSDPLKENTSCP